ncbi:MAG: M50 family metallopeptidase [Chlamydiales bacterium]|nr:M50 family metallopeptidase [Chlamydiales bacterium]
MITIPGRIPISIHPLFWLIAFFIGWIWTMTLAGALVCIAVILFSVLFHEFGHALTAMLFGQKTRIELAAFGGFTYREGPKLKLWEEFLVVLNGPIAGFLLFLIAFAIFQNVEIESPLLLFTVKFTFVANLFWTVINLVPVLPLDGGHLLSIILEAIFGFKGVKLAIIVGLIIAVAISIFFFALGMFLIGALFLILTFESFRSLRYYKIFSEQDRDSNLQELMKAADADFQAGRSAEALTKLEEVRLKTKEGILYTLATQEMAEIYRNQERYEEAYQLLVPIHKTLSTDNLATFHFLAFMNGDYQTVVEIGNKCYQDNPSADTALINALAHGALSDAEPAVGWLECSVREGLTSVKEAVSREEFDPIRNDPRFRSFEETYKS